MMLRTFHSGLRGRFVAACCVVAGIAALSAGALPRALIIGDEIYREPAANVAKDLKGRVEVIRRELPKGEVLNSSTALVHLDTLLGDEKWDLIHFNIGLGDLIYRAPGMKAFRVMPRDNGGVRTTDPTLYQSNLRELVRRLKATKAKLVWATTTPIRASTTKVFELGSETQYNAIAAKIMAENRIPTNDMESYVRSVINMDKPAPHGWDPFYFDKKPIHEPVAKVILDQLGLR